VIEGVVSGGEEEAGARGLSIVREAVVGITPLVEDGGDGGISALFVESLVGEMRAISSLLLPSSSSESMAKST